MYKKGVGTNNKLSKCDWTSHSVKAHLKWGVPHRKTTKKTNKKKIIIIIITIKIKITIIINK